MPQGQIDLSHEFVKQLGTLAQALELEDLRLVLVLVEEVEACYYHVAVSKVCGHVILLLLWSGSG